MAIIKRFVAAKSNLRFDKARSRLVWLADGCVHFFEEAFHGENDQA